MSSHADDVDAEYMDDPISLMATDVKKELVDADQIIDIQSSSDEEETYTSFYGKKNFVLPVTFFDNTRNIRLLNKCKPMSISIVNCKQYPTYYTESGEKNNSKSDDSSVEIDNKHKSDSEPDPNSVDAQNVAINTSITIHEVDKEKECEKKRRVQDVNYKSGEKNNSKFHDNSEEINNRHKSDSDPESNSVDAQNFVINTTIHEADKKKEGEKKHRLHDVYYKGGEQNNSKFNDNSEEINNRHKSDSEPETNSVDAQNVVINTSIAIHEADKKKEGEKKRRGPKGKSFYEKLKRRKEKRKQVALNCKDLSQVDFKRNTGLVGLKITDTVFNQIVNTEKALVRMKKPAGSKCKKSNENALEKPLITQKNNAPEEKCKETNSVVEKALSVVKSAETKSKKNKRSDSEKGSVVTTIIDSTKHNNNMEASESVVERPLTKTDLTHVENKCNNNLDKDAQNTSRTSIISAKDRSKEKSKSNMYMKEVGAALDNLGTSIIPISVTHTKNAASNNINVNDNIENKSSKIHKNSATIDKLKNSNDIEMRCSLKIPSKKIVEKVLKLKEVKSISKHVSDVLKNTIIEQSPKEIITKSHTVPKLDIKSSKRYIVDSCVVPEKDKLQHKSMDVAYSRQTKQMEKSFAKNASRNDQPGSNSPVIPCTTITTRVAPPKSTQNISSPNNSSQSVKKVNATTHITPPKIQNHSLPPTNIVDPKSNDAQKPFQLPKIATVNQADVSNNSGCTYITLDDSPKQLTIIAQTNVKASSDLKDTSMCTDNSTENLKTLKITEYKRPNNYSLAERFIDFKNKISAPNLADKNMSKTNLTKEANQVNAPIKSARFSGNAVHINNHTTNGLFNNPNPNLHISPSTNPKFSRPNAIIFRRPSNPSRDFQNNTLPNQGQPIQTVINYRAHLPMPHGSTPMRFRLPPPYPPPPPNYPPPPPNYASPSSLLQIRQNQIIIPSRMSSAHLPAIGMGNNLRFPGPRPPGYRTPLQVPPRHDNIQMNQGPQNPQVYKHSFIGNTANGDPIKKINIPAASLTDAVNDKQMMLTELNNAIISPELTVNNDDRPINDLKRKVDPKPTEPVKPKFSKPCPLSKKINSAKDSNNEKIPDKAPPNFGYSPPILPIMTYEESFQKFKNDTNTQKGFSTSDRQYHTPSRVKCTASIMKLNSKKQKRTQTELKQDKAKKITFEDYRKRAKDGGDRIDVDKIRKHNESKNVTDDYNQDLGYDSDSTVKL